MQLVLARSTSQPDQPASRVFDPNQIEVLHALQNKLLQGRTARAAKPSSARYPVLGQLIVARLGAGPATMPDKSTGPITMRDGLERFYGLVDGYNLAKNVCPS